MKKRIPVIIALTVSTLTVSGCGQTGESVTRLETSSGNLQMEASAPVTQAGAVSDFTAEASAAAPSETAAADNDNIITEEKATEIALLDAGVPEADIIGFRIEKKTEHKNTFYDVEFYANSKEYDYEISVSDGTILSKDMEIEEDFRSPSSAADGAAENLISQEKVLEIVLARVPGATAENVRIKLDSDDGHQVYEGEIRFDGKEYEFELNAETGDILEWSQELLD